MCIACEGHVVEACGLKCFACFVTLGFAGSVSRRIFDKPAGMKIWILTSMVLWCACNIIIAFSQGCYLVAATSLCSFDFFRISGELHKGRQKYMIIQGQVFCRAYISSFCLGLYPDSHFCGDDRRAGQPNSRCTGSINASDKCKHLTTLSSTILSIVSCLHNLSF